MMGVASVKGLDEAPDRASEDRDGGARDSGSLSVNKQHVDGEMWPDQLWNVNCVVTYRGGRNTRTNREAGSHCALALTWNTQTQHSSDYL